jgi:predicted DCC family thiol-disulfide oxidoreductase YuxK
MNIMAKQTKDKSSPALSVYYDGLCPLCYREIEHYLTLKGSSQIRFVDITHSEFSAPKEGVDPKKVHQHLHSRNAAGEIKTGIDAFVEIWRILPRYRLLASIASTTGIKPLLQLAYAGFARVRPLLPRRERASCDESPFCEMKGKA